MTKANTLIKKFSAILPAGLLVFSNTLMVNAAVKPDDTVKPYYVNISGTNGALYISRIKAEYSASLKSKKSVNFSIKRNCKKKNQADMKPLKLEQAVKREQF